MTIDLITSPDAPPAAGPYSHAAAAGDLVFLSGQLPIDPATGELVTDDVVAAFRRCVANAATVLAARGATLDDVVKVTVFLTDLSEFPAVNTAYADVFAGHAPARSCVEVSRLPMGAPVEVELIAQVSR